MRSSRWVAMVCALLGMATTTDGQPAVATSNETRKIRLDSIKAEISRCEAHRNECFWLPLLQARLNQLIKIGMMLGEDDAAPAAPPGSTPPPSAADYQSLRAYLSKIAGNDSGVMNVSPERAQIAVIDYCVGMNDPQVLGGIITPQELQTAMSQGVREQVKTKVQKCIAEYDPKQVAANRKAAIEHCLKTNDYTAGGQRTAYDACINANDIMQAMCNQALRLRAAYMWRDKPGGAPPQVCQGLSLPAAAVQSIVRSGSNSGPPGVPASLLSVPTAPITPITAPGSVAIPEGTVLDVTLMATVWAEVVAPGRKFSATLDHPVQSNGKDLIPPHSLILVKARVVGPGPKPNTVQIGVSLDSFQTVEAKTFSLASNEIVYTLAAHRGLYVAGFQEAIPQMSKLSFTTHN